MFLAWALFFAPALHAHPGYLTAADAKVQRDGTFSVELTFDVLAFALDDLPERISDEPMNALLDGPPAELERLMTDARRRFVRHCEVRVDGAVIAPAQVQFPSPADVQRWVTDTHAPRLPVLLSAMVTGTLPAGAHQVAFVFPDVIGNVVLTVERPGLEPVTQALRGGETSAPVTVTTAVAAARDRLIPPEGRRGADMSAVGSVQVGLSAIGSAKAETPSYIETLRALLQFVRLGFEHIVPRGLDHVLFVLGLFLLGGRLSTLLWQVTAFTIAHSVTLGLSLYGVVHLPSGVIEPLIALSIVLVAADNLRGGELRWWRVAVVFGFGLVHGLGFAGALRDLGLPRSEFLRALIGFNAGVELGQLAVVAGAFFLVGWWRGHARYRRFVVAPASTAIAVVALVWTLQRIAG